MDAAARGLARTHPAVRLDLKHYLVTLLISLAPVSSSWAALSPRVEKLLNDAGIPSAAVGTASLSEDGTPLNLHQAERSMRAASVMKLLTTAVALERLGPNWTWPTEAYAGGPIGNGVLQGPLILKGYGDPALTFERFWLIVNQLRSSGLQSIEGGLVIDQSFFDQAPDDTPPRIDAPWEIIPKPLMVNLQVERLFFEPNGNRVRIRAEPDLGWRFISDLPMTDGPCPQDVEDAWIPTVDWQTQTARISGKFPQSCATRVLNLGITDDRYYIGTMFQTLWRQSGGTFNGSTAYGQVTPTSQLLARVQSPPLSRAIIEQNKFSSNPMARQLYLSLGKSYRLPQKTVAGSAEAAIRRWLKEKGLHFPELALENGSGLSRKEQLSPANWARLLHAMAQSPFAAEFEASMPILGMDGTLRRRLSSSPAAGWGHLKTGTLSDTSAVAGYIRTKHGRRVSVVFLVNYPNAGRAWPAMEAWLSEQYESKGSD